MKCRMCKADAVEGKSCCQAHLEYNAERERANRAKVAPARRRASLCPRCGDYTNPRRIYCVTCLADTKLRRDKQKSKGVCACGDRAAESHTLCEVCLAKMKAISDSRWKSRIDQGLCGSCGARPRTDGKQQCGECRDDQRTRRKTHLDNGICPRCACRPLMKACTICKECWFREKASTHLGSTKRWRELDALFEAQHGVCPGTGLKMEIGIDASVDHIVPLSRGGSNDLTNIRFVIHWYNLLKHRYLPEEFKSKITLVYNKMKSEEAS